MIVAVAAPLLVASGAGAGWLLRRAWADRSRERRDLHSIAWGGAVLLVALSAILIGPVLGVAVALVLLPIGALGVVASGVAIRTARAPRPGTLAPEPLEGPSRIWRGALKALLAGPLGMLAAMGIAFCYAVWVPGAIQTRLLIAALLVPGLWGLAMTWTLADQRIVRSTGVLSGTAILGFALAFAGRLA